MVATTILQYLLLSAIITSTFGCGSCDDHKNYALDNKCEHTKGIKVEANKEIYEGRWHLIYTASSSESMNEQLGYITCESWDIFFDKKGNIHVFINNPKNIWPGKNIEEIGLIKDEVNGQYLEVAGHNESLVDTLYYVDEDLLAVWEEECSVNKEVVQRNIVIALRKTSNLEANRDKIIKISKEFEANGGKPGKNIIYENCKIYPKLEKKDLPQLN